MWQFHRQTSGWRLSLTAVPASEGAVFEALTTRAYSRARIAGDQDCVKRHGQTYWAAWHRMPASRERTSRDLPPLELRTKYWFEIEGKFVIGEGGVELLRAIERTGSLVRAAQSVGWSYRHAWGYIRRAEDALDLQLTERRSGKGVNRGINLTRAARRLLRRAPGSTRRVGSPSL